MLDIALKNITRQRTRTFLTVLGIIIGIAAVIALGSVAEGINTYIQGSLELSAGKIMVQQKGSSGIMGGGMGSDITEEQMEEISSLDGVKDISPLVLYFKGFQPGREPELVVAGIDPEKSNLLVGEKIEMYRGKDLEADETGVMVLGKTISDNLNLDVGDYMTIKDTELEVIGIIEYTGNANVDESVIVNIKDLQDILDIDTYQMLYVVPEDIRESEIISEEIEDLDETLSAMTSKDIARQASEMINQIRIFTIGIGGIAAVVGGLGVLNTMIMAVLERRREIGVMKAIGATNNMVLKQILTESIMISFIGGIIGILLGLSGALVLNYVTGGGLRAIVTPGLAFGGLLFAVFLGLAGGLYPSWKAARLDPVQALRYE